MKPLNQSESALLLMGAIGVDDPESTAMWLEAGSRGLAELDSSPLAKASQWNAWRVAAALLDQGHDWRARDGAGLDALEGAALSGAEQVLSLLCARLDQAHDGQERLARAICKALQRPSLGTLSIALDHFDVGSASGAWLGEIMAKAVESGEVGSVKMLLDRGWSADMEVERSDPCPLLHGAGAVGYRSQGFWGSGQRRLDALGWAVLLGKWDGARLLIERGANAKSAYSSGASVLMLAAQMQSAKTVEALLARGADANARDAQGDSPLHWASCYSVSIGNTGCTRALLDAGADASVCGSMGMAPLDLFMERWSADADLALLACRVDPRPEMKKWGHRLKDLTPAAIQALKQGARGWEARDEGKSIGMGLGNGLATVKAGAKRL